MSKHRPESVSDGIPAGIVIDRVRHPNRQPSTAEIMVPGMRPAVPR